MDINYFEIGKRLAKKRHSLELKQYEVAEMAEITNNYLSNIENGKSIPSIKTLVTLCSVLDTTPDYFLMGVSKTNDSYQKIIQLLTICNKQQLETIFKIITYLINQ